MSLEDKVTGAVSLLRDVLPSYKRPIVASSFGKDSMVVLDLLKHAGFKLPILFFREPFFPKKYAFANAVIGVNGYIVYDYPPRATFVSQRGSVIEIVNQHDTQGLPILLPTGTKAPRDGEPFLCALQDIYNKPLGTYAFPWDVVVGGAKSTDVDPILGPVPLSTAHALGSPSVLFPLRDFTDADVWDYTKHFGLPINHGRYDAANGWREFDDVTYNPDYFTACTACMDETKEAAVFCPLTGGEVQNVSSKLRRFDRRTVPEYMRGEE